MDQISISINEPEDPAILSVFEELANTAAGYMDYTNAYGSVEDWRDEFASAEHVFQGLIVACKAYTKHESLKTPADGEFFKMMRAGFKSMKHAYNPPPMDPLSDSPLPDALQTVYRHMGYTPVEDVIFWNLVTAFESASFRCAWGGCWIGYDECICESKYWRMYDILEWRDFPRAVTYMRRFFPGFEEMDDAVFCDLCLTFTEYLEYTNDFDNWNDPKIAAFREFSVVADYATYVCPDYFQKYTDLPGELREIIMHEYLLLERDAGRLSKHQHYDEFSNPCCKWEYPRVLIACDNQDTKVFPEASTGRCPKGWLPNLAFVSHQIHEEVLVHMLWRTERFDLKYLFRNTNFKIAAWFSTFLKAIARGKSGQTAVKHLNFPHMHWFNHQRISPAVSNPSLELAVICKNLRKLDMTFHVDKVTRPLHEVIKYFKMETIFGCTNLEGVYIDGIYIRPSRGGDAADLDVLEDLGKWMMKGFLVQRNLKRGIQVDLVRRWGAWRGRVRGDLVTLTDTDMAEVKTRIGVKNAYAKALTVAGPSPTI
jgi:hypothetical protein